MILVAFIGSARAWRLVWREQLVWLSDLLEKNDWRWRTYSTRIAHEQMDAMAAKWKARGVKLVEANYKLQKLPGPKGVVYMSE